MYCTLCFALLGARIGGDFLGLKRPGQFIAVYCLGPAPGMKDVKSAELTCNVAKLARKVPSVELKAHRLIANRPQSQAISTGKERGDLNDTCYGTQQLSEGFRLSRRLRERAELTLQELTHSSQQPQGQIRLAKLEQTQTACLTSAYTKTRRLDLGLCGSIVTSQRTVWLQTGRLTLRICLRRHASRESLSKKYAGFKLRCKADLPSRLWRGSPRNSTTL